MPERRFANERIASHARSSVKFHYSTTFEHMPPEHQAVRSWTAEGFSQWAKSVGPETAALTNAFLAVGRHKEQGFRSILGLKRLAEKFGMSALEEAAKIANTRRIVSQRFVQLHLPLLSRTRIYAAKPIITDLTFNLVWRNIC